MNLSEQLLLLLISLVANVFSAFAGGGAGLLQFPALIFLGLPFGVALATHKVASVALGIGATLRHVKERSLEAGRTGAREVGRKVTRYRDVSLAYKLRPVAITPKRTDGAARLRNRPTQTRR